jgi:hypothetical protein
MLRKRSPSPEAPSSRPCESEIVDALARRVVDAERESIRDSIRATNFGRFEGIGSPLESGSY